MRVVLTKKQNQHLEEIFEAFNARAQESEVIPPTLKIQLKVIQGMIEDDLPFEQVEFNILIWILDAYFEKFTGTDIDPLAEQAYAKLTGYFPFDEPWYARVQRLQEPVLGYKPPAQRPRIGF